MSNDNIFRMPGFLVFLLGGVGSKAGAVIRQRYEEDMRPFPLRMAQLDTDPVKELSAHTNLLTPMTQGVLDSIHSDPMSFGSVAERVVKHYPTFLNHENTRNGSRTHRFLTQLSFEHSRDRIADWIHRAILSLKRIGNFDFIQPVMVSSSGGGAP